MPIIPTETEIQNWIFHVVQHVCNIEYYLRQLQLGSSDFERPHDLVGPGNKFEWEVICGFAVQNRKDGINFDKDVLPSLIVHRQQYHHRKWHDPDPLNPKKKRPDSSADDMMVGAVDTICSLRENRQYLGGKHSWQEIQAICLTNAPHKISWLLAALKEMKPLAEPQLELITGLDSIPNIGIDPDLHQIVIIRVGEVRKMLRQRGYSLK